MAKNASMLRKRLEKDPIYADSRDAMTRLEPTAPVYLFSKKNLRRAASGFQADFHGLISYAVKANPEARVIRVLSDQGIKHFDVASIGEVEAIATLCPQATLHFNNPVKAFEAIEQAYHGFGVKSFALDEASELTKIRKATNNATDVMYSVRFKLGHRGASYDFGSKFGTWPDKAALLLREVAAVGARPALTFHPGSQCGDPQIYASYLQAAANIVRVSGVAIEQINVGGGFPVQYANVDVPNLRDYFQTIEQAASTYFDKQPRLMCEPGRAMAASSVSLLTRVIHVRDDRRSLFVNDGVYGGMQEQSVVDLRLPVKPWRNGRELYGPTNSYQVFGPTCDPIDRLTGEMALPAGLRPGDYLEFGLLGAYGSATATAFNGFESASYIDVMNGFQAG